MTRFDGPIGFTMAYGAAFAPDPELGPPFFDYPYELINGKVKVIPEVWRRWEDGLGNWKEKISEYSNNLARPRGIVIDYGTEDKYIWIPRGASIFPNSSPKQAFKTRYTGSKVVVATTSGNA